MTIGSIGPTSSPTGPLPTGGSFIRNPKPHPAATPKTYPDPPMAYFMSPNEIDAWAAGLKEGDRVAVHRAPGEYVTGRFALPSYVVGFKNGHMQVSLWGDPGRNLSFPIGSTYTKYQWEAHGYCIRPLED